MHILIGLLLAFLLIAIFSNRKTRGCRWRMDKDRDEGDQRFFICMACGQTCLTSDGKMPRVCKKDPGR